MRHQKGYSWFFFHMSSSLVTGLLSTVLVVGTGSLFYTLYYQFGNDIAPDSIAGYAYAIIGTCCILLAAILYTIQRRSRKRSLGQLNVAQNWHIFFATTGIAFIFMHSFGNFNAKTGTYALYSLIALIISGFVGRALDRIVPWLIAREVDKVLTPQGEDRVESISRNLQTQAETRFHPPLMSGLPSRLPGSPSQGFSISRRQGLPHGRDISGPYNDEGQPMNMPWHPWDMAFLTPANTRGKNIGEEDIRNFMSSNHIVPVQAGLLMSQARQHLAEIRKTAQALEREQFYRYLIHYWRLFHVLLALLTVGLIIWHLVYVGQLLTNAFMHR